MGTVLPITRGSSKYKMFVLKAVEEAKRLLDFARLGQFLKWIGFKMDTVSKTGGSSKYKGEWIVGFCKDLDENFGRALA